MRGQTKDGRIESASMHKHIIPRTYRVRTSTSRAASSRSLSDVHGHRIYKVDSCDSSEDQVPSLEQDSHADDTRYAVPM